MEYEDFYPRQMKFRETLNRDYPHKRKKRPGSFQPAIKSENDRIEPDISKKVSIVPTTLSNDIEDSKDWIPSKQKLKAYSSKAKKNQPCKVTSQQYIKPISCRKKSLADCSNHYRYNYQIVSSKEEIQKLYNCSINEYLILISEKNTDIGCLYNKKSIKFRSKSNLNVIYKINRILEKHLTLTNRKINIICNDNDTLSQLFNFNSKKSKDNLNERNVTTFLKNIRKYGYNIVVWKCNDQIVSMDRWIKSIELSKLL